MGTRAGLDYPEGDPGGLSAAASRLAALAAAVAAQAGQVARAGSVPGWRGKSSALFAVAAAGLAQPLVASAEPLHRASRAVEDLADQLTQVQQQIRGWAREIEEAERQAEQARAALTAVMNPASPFAEEAWDLGRRRDAQGRYNVAAQQVADLLARYRPKASRLCEQIERADRRTSSAVLAAADVAPAGGAGVPGGRVPADVRVFAPFWVFTPSEDYLPADPRSPALDFRDFRSIDDWEQYRRGQGAGAPIFYQVRRFGDEKIIEYWFYRRWDDFRDLGIHTHRHDSEGVAVRIRNGRPVQIGYSKHEGGCSLPFGEATKRRGHPISFPSDGSGANSPYRGTADNEVNVLGIDVNPIDDVHGAAPGERTPRDHIVHGDDNPHRYRPGDWRVDDRDKVPGSPGNMNGNWNKFKPEAPIWSEECERLRPRD